MQHVLQRVPMPPQAWFALIGFTSLSRKEGNDTGFGCEDGNGAALF